MGNQFSVFQNKCGTEMEIRVFVPPARPDKYRKIIRIRAGGMKILNAKELMRRDDDHPEQQPIYLMIFMDGVHTGMTLFPSDIKKYAKILSYVDDNGVVHLKCRRFRLPRFCSRAHAPEF